MGVGAREKTSPPPPPFFLSPTNHPQGRNLFLSPTFLCLKNPRWRPNISRKKSERSLTKNTPALQTKIIVMSKQAKSHYQSNYVSMHHNSSKSASADDVTKFSSRRGQFYFLPVLLYFIKTAIKRQFRSKMKKNVYACMLQRCSIKSYQFISVG